MTLRQALIRAVADAEGTDPSELEIALEDHVSMAAIQRLDEHKSESWTLRFELPNHTVEISGDGTILVDEARTRACP
ncbi:HalOD1 output domain-containing protein [Halopenitus persicus]|uniref:Halobacterial output domain-containing protein n=1 Tax=Halopenitus persicus TaxID=1048396 RepID=A0A1H3EGK3_9EURY|nr:HalOD1 output domain-containing protein [Halopenitus persicus]QHS17557.1 hypothetical protein GWK26_10590 [haloarchaeon 3A1-DGR]SDX77821.1 hypothetical protein SAMN05216564_101434 [Halopenitus persicus]